MTGLRNPRGAFLREVARIGVGHGRVCLVWVVGDRALEFHAAAEHFG